MNSLITGGAGFIGSRLFDRLRQYGPVVAYDNFSTGKTQNILKLAGNTHRIVHGDITNANGLTWAMQEDIDVVFHLAANTNARIGVTYPDIDIHNGLIGTLNVLQAMVRSKVNKLVFTSTCGVYGDDAVTPLAEDYMPLRPICPYAMCKLASEALVEKFVKECGIQAWIIRVGNAIGGGMTNGVILQLLEKLRDKPTVLKVLGSRKPSRPFHSVEDCADGILYAFEHSNERVNRFNVASSGSVNIGQIVDMIVDEMKLSILVKYDKQDRGWDGSAVEVNISVDKINGLGWKAKLSPEEAVLKAIKEIRRG